MKRLLLILFALLPLVLGAQPMTLNEPGGKVFPTYVAGTTNYTPPFTYWFSFLSGPVTNTVPYFCPMLSWTSSVGSLVLTNNGTPATNANIGVLGGPGARSLTNATITLVNGTDWTVTFTIHRWPFGITAGSGIEEWWGFATGSIDGFYTSNSVICIGFGGTLFAGTTTTDIATSGAISRSSVGDYTITKIGTNVSVYTNGVFASHLPTPTADIHLQNFTGGSTSFGATCSFYYPGVNTSVGLIDTDVLRYHQFVLTNGVVDNTPTDLVFSFPLNDASSGSVPTNTASSVGGFNAVFSAPTDLVWIPSFQTNFGNALRSINGAKLIVTNSGTIANGTNCSWCLWVRTGGTSGAKQVMAKGQEHTVAPIIHTELENEYLHMFVQSDGSHWLGTHGITLTGDTGWHLAIGAVTAAAVASNSTLVGFIDSNYMPNDDNGPNGAGTNLLQLNGYWNSTNDWTMGNDFAAEGANAAWDLPQVYNHALTAREAWALFWAGAFTRY